MLSVPLLRENEAIGSLSIRRTEIWPFSAKQIELATTFADQAVIAIENARLFDEVQARTREVQELLEYQTAISDVLSVISRSPARNRTCARGDRGNGASAYAILSRFLSFSLLMAWPASPPPGMPMQRVWNDLKKSYPNRSRAQWPAASCLNVGTVHIPDALADPEYEVMMRPSARTLLGVPLLREGATAGVIVLNRTVVQPFTEKEIELVTTFADQAVIAIENARLFDEVQARTKELTETLEQQTATSKVLEVISRSAFDLHAVFEAVAESSARLCGADRANIFRFDGEVLRVAAAFNAPKKLTDWLERNPIQPGRHSVAARAALERRTIQVTDVLADLEHTYGAKDVEPFRTVLGVPILKGDDDLLWRHTVSTTPRSGGSRISKSLWSRLSPISLPLPSKTFGFWMSCASAPTHSGVRSRNCARSATSARRSTRRSTSQLCSTPSSPRRFSFLTPKPARSTNSTNSTRNCSALHLRDDGGTDRRHCGTSTSALASRRSIGPAPAASPCRLRTLRPALRRPPETLSPVPVSAPCWSFRCLDLSTSLVCWSYAAKSRAAFPQNTVDLLKTFAAQSVLAIQNAHLFTEIDEKSRQLENREPAQIPIPGEHEPRAAHPLNAILGYTELILDSIYGEPSEKMREVLERLHANGKHLLGLINDVLDLSKIEAGQLTLDLADYSLADLVHTVLHRR